MSSFKMQPTEGLLLIIATLTVGAQALFTPGRHLVYQYHAVAQAGTSTPYSAASSWELRGKLNIQAQDGAAIVKLSKLTVSLHNGQLDDSSDHSFHPTPPETDELLKPFIVHYENNKITAITVGEKEQQWSVNIKRALANVLQLDESQFNLKAFITQENTLYGECNTEYSISEEDGKIIARKYIDINEVSCRGFPILRWSNVSPFICMQSPQTVSTSAGRKYVLVQSEAGSLNLESIQSRGGTNIQPFQALGEIQYVFVNQSLTLEANEKIAETLKAPEDAKRVGLTYELPKSDLTHGRAPMTGKQALKLIDFYLGKLSDSVKINPLLVEPNELHDQQLAHLLHFLSLLDKPTLEQYYQNLAIGTSYQQETIRNLFLKLLPQVGSNPSVLLIRDLVYKIKDNSTLVELLTVLPFYVRQPSEALLKECEKFLSLGDSIHPNVRSAAVLSFATLVHKTCRVGCQSATLDRYILKFVDLFSGSCSYEDQILYLEALNNIELGDVYEYVEPIIRGNVTIFTKQPHHIRFLGVWATMSAAYNPTKTLKIYQTYWPILTNRSEHLEMRVAALTMLMLSGPTHGNFFNLLWFMESEPNAHLQHFFYTTLVSLIDTKYPCYKSLGSVAAHLIRFVKAPSASNWATGNYILDYSDPRYGFGSMSQLFAVANQRTGNPNILHLVLDYYAIGFTIRRLELYLKLEGVGDLLKSIVLDKQVPAEKLIHLIALLKEIKAPVISTESIHIEIIAKIEGKVILCQYINGNTLDKLQLVVAQIERIIPEFHINYQSVKAPILVEQTQLSDIGVPLLFRLDSSVLLSLRGDFIRDTSVSPFTRRIELDIKYALTGGGSVVIYNPIQNLWHGTRRSHSYQSYIPIRQKITFAPNRIVFSFQKSSDLVAGVLAHAQTTVEIRGTDSAQILKQFCPSCPTNFIVKRRNEGNHSYDLMNIALQSLGMKLGASMFDCDHPYTTSDYLELLQGIVSENYKNYRVLYPSRYVLGLSHLIDVLTLLPPHGSCGLKIQLASTNQEATEIEAGVQFKKEQISSESRKHELSLSLSHKIQGSRTSLQDWIIGIVYKHLQDGTKRNLRIRLTNSVKGKHSDKLCLDSEIRMPKADDGVLLPWTPSEPAAAKINLIWGSIENVPSGQCPQEGLDISIVATGEITEEQQALINSTKDGPRGTCWRDTKNIEEWGAEYTPITGACYQASYELATLRKYTTTIKHNNVPKHVASTSARVGAVLEVLQPGITSDIKDSNLVITLEVPVSQPHIKLLINKQQIYLDNGKSWIEPLLLNTRFSPALPIAMKLSLVGSCIVNSARVISFDGASNNFSATPCYSLIAADCTPHPKFAVLVKRSADAKLAVKVHIEDSEVEIEPSKSGKLQVSVDGQSIKLEAKDYYHDHQSNRNTYTYKIHLVDNGQVRVTYDTFWLQHNGPFLILVSYVGQKGQLCGLCGDFNGDGSNDGGQALVLPC